MDISFIVCLFVCVFVRLRISPPRIKLAASNFALWFIGVQGRESSILGNFVPPEAPQKPKIGRIGGRRQVDASPLYRQQAREARPGRPSACVDILPSPKTYVPVLLSTPIMFLISTLSQLCRLGFTVLFTACY